MIHKLLSTIDNWRLPQGLLSRVWDTDGETISDLKSFALETNEDLSHLDWRVIDVFVTREGYSDSSALMEVFSSPIVGVNDLREDLARVGVKPSESQRSLQKWLMVLDKFHVHKRTQRELSPQSKSPNDTQQIPSEKSKGKKTEDDSTLSEAEAEAIDREAHRNLKIYQDSGEELALTEESLVVQEPKEGLGPYRPVDINNSFHNGYLYYPVQTVIGKKIKKKHGEPIAEKVETVVIRSDRTLQHIVKSERLKDSDGGHDVYRLTDGTLIGSIPKPNAHGTWSWEYIDQFLKGENQEIHLADAIRTIRTHLRSRVWLPLESDYTLLAVTAAATYVQSIFNSVPLILLVGPAGSGKSEVASAMVEMSANATMIGQVTAPTMMRLINESGGLCAIDDLESVGVSRTGQGGKQKFSEIAQVLKVSYKKSTATRMVTNPSTRRTEIMNFFGIKIVSNTKGVDDILGSRMLHVHTRKVDQQTLSTFQSRESVEDDVLEDLRNRLHSWAFENVDLVHRTYMSISAKQSNREDEISQPLRTMAKLSADEEIILDLERALSAQSKRKNRFKSASEVLKEILESLVLQGYEAVSITHVMLELRREMDPGYEIDYAMEMPGWSKQEWIGRKLRELNVINPSSSFRKRVRGQNLRFVTFKKEYLRKVISSAHSKSIDRKPPESFCQECQTCPFANHSCDLTNKGDFKKAS